MYIEEGDAIAFAKHAAFNVVERPANLAQAANRNRTGNQRIRNTLQASLLQVNIRAANL